MRRHACDDPGSLYLPSDEGSTHSPRDAARHHGGERVFRGVYRSPAAEDNETLRMRALRMVVGDEPVWAGLTAARLHGAPVGRTEEPLDLVGQISGHHRHREGVRMRRLALREGDIVEHELGLTLSVLRCAVDLATTARHPWQIGQLDQVLRVGGLTAWDVRRELGDRWYHGMRGRRIADLAVAQCDPRSESVPESELRLLILGLPVPPPVPQLEVHDDVGDLVGRLDLGWAKVKVGMEYDGAYHDDPEQYRRDRGRHNRFRECGWTVYQLDRSTARDRRALHGLLAPHFA